MQVRIDTKLRCHIDCMDWQPFSREMHEVRVRKLNPFSCNDVWDKGNMELGSNAEPFEKKNNGGLKRINCNNAQPRLSSDRFRSTLMLLGSSIEAISKLSLEPKTLAPLGFNMLWQSMQHWLIDSSQLTTAKLINISQGTVIKIETGDHSMEPSAWDGTRRTKVNPFKGQK